MGPHPRPRRRRRAPGRRHGPDPVRLLPSAEPIGPPLSDAPRAHCLDSSVMSDTAPYNPNTKGWPAAIATSLLALGLLFFAYSVHNNTYRHPRDPMFKQVYSDQKAAH